MNDIVFSKDGKFVASASADHTVRIWDTNGGGQKTLRDAPDWNYCVSFSPDAKFIAAGGGDGSVHIWDVNSGALAASLIASGAKSTDANWFVVAPMGYVSTSPTWKKRIRLMVADSPLTIRTAAILAVLQNPASVLKSLHGEKVDAPNIAPPAASPSPTVPAKK